MKEITTYEELTRLSTQLSDIDGEMPAIVTKGMNALSVLNDVNEIISNEEDEECNIEALGEDNCIQHLKWKAKSYYKTLEFLLLYTTIFDDIVTKVGEEFQYYSVNKCNEFLKEML